MSKLYQGLHDKLVALAQALNLPFLWIRNFVDAGMWWFCYWMIMLSLLKEYIALIFKDQ